jgi:hypothetical protein
LQPERDKREIYPRAADRNRKSTVEIRDYPATVRDRAATTPLNENYYQWRDKSDARSRLKPICCTD